MANASEAPVRQLFELSRDLLNVHLRAGALFRSPTDIGEIRAESIRNFLESLLPATYSVGVGEVIDSHGGHTHEQDVVVYDNASCSVFAWPNSPLHLFPIESVYAVIEVKSILANPNEAIEQATRVRELKSQDATAYPFTAVLAKKTNLPSQTIFDAISKKEPEKRVDFLLIIDTNEYFTHWLYMDRDPRFRSVADSRRRIKFVRAREKAEHSDSVLLTYAKDEYAIMWFYLSLLDHLTTTRLKVTDVGAYAQAYGIPLGWQHNE